MSQATSRQNPRKAHQPQTNQPYRPPFKIKGLRNQTTNSVPQATTTSPNPFAASYTLMVQFIIPECVESALSRLKLINFVTAHTYTLIVEYFDSN